MIDHIIDNRELPIGFTMELALHSDSLARFARLPESERIQLVNRAREIHSREEMRTYVENMFRD